MWAYQIRINLIGGRTRWSITIIESLRVGRLLWSPTCPIDYFKDVNKFQADIEANRDKIGLNFEIYPGMRLKIPKI